VLLITRMNNSKVEALDWIRKYFNLTSASLVSFAVCLTKNENVKVLISRHTQMSNQLFDKKQAIGLMIRNNTVIILINSILLFYK